MPVDSYCERTGPEFWSEPANAITNLAFLIAALFAYRYLARSGRPAPASLVFLVITLVAIGLGSFTFHTVATRWAAALDTTPILIFILAYVVNFAHWFFDVAWKWALLGIPAFIAVAAGINLLMSAFGIRGAGVGAYLPALVGMVVFAIALLVKGDDGRRRYASHFAGVAVLFGVSLTLRTIDDGVCGQFPLGTHFAWHVCNATMLFLVLRALVLRWREKSACADGLPLTQRR